MRNLVGRLDRETLQGQVVLPNLKPLETEYRRMTYGRLRTENPLKGVVQLFYPGPVVVWYTLGNRNEVHVRIYHNGGNVTLADELAQRLAKYTENMFKES